MATDETMRDWLAPQMRRADCPEPDCNMWAGHQGLHSIAPRARHTIPGWAVTLFALTAGLAMLAAAARIHLETALLAGCGTLLVGTAIAAINEMRRH
jgi:hypothetical protein